MPMLRNFVTPLLRETVRSMLLETGPSTVTVSFAEGDDATTALFTGDPAAGTLALVNALDAADFAFNAATGVLTWAITPDYEAQISHSVDISTTDGDGEVTLQRVTVRITPVSEFAPSFGATPTTVSVAENVSAAIFWTPSVTDADAGETITFALSGTHAALFTINATTGALRFTSAADFENGQGAGAGGNVYDVTITASDGTQSTAHSLQITVTDVADDVSAAAIQLRSGAYLLDRAGSNIEVRV
jgi:VCBS repeat-containing protein